MGMASELCASEFAHETDERRIPIHRLNRAQAQPGKIGLFYDCADKRGECADGGACRVEIAAPSAKVDPGEHKFMSARGDEAAHVREDRLCGKASRIAPRLRNDAER